MLVDGDGAELLGFEQTVEHEVGNEHVHVVDLEKLLSEQFRHPAVLLVDVVHPDGRTVESFLPLPDEGEDPFLVLGPVSGLQFG